MKKLGELLGDCLIVSCGALMLFVFITIEMKGSFGKEDNDITRWFELLFGGVIFAFGIYRFWDDLKDV